MSVPRLVVLSLSVLAACVSEPDSRAPVFLGPSQLEDARVTRPGFVLIDHEARFHELQTLAKMSPDRFFQVCGDRAFPRPPINSVDSPTGYGLDRRFFDVKTGIRKMGSGCLDGDDEQCRFLLAMLLDWSKRNAAQVTKGFGSGKYWNDTLTVNSNVVLPFATQYAVVRSRIPVAAEDERIIKDWLTRTIRSSSHLMRNEGIWEGSTVPKAAQNHAISSAAAWMAFGALWGDDVAFGHGIDQWFITLNSMRTDGSLPAEARRGARAISYSGLAISGLVGIAEMAAVQGIDLYTLPAPTGGTIHDAIRFLLDAYENPGVIFRYSSENYIPGEESDYRKIIITFGDVWGWAPPYIRRFPEHPNSLRARKHVEQFQPLDPATIGAETRCFFTSPIVGHW